MLNTGAGADKYFVAPAPAPQEMFKNAPAPEKMLGSSSSSPALLPKERSGVDGSIVGTPVFKTKA